MDNSPSETTEKLAGCWILSTQQIKGDISRWGLCSLEISKNVIVRLNHNK
jgi:hypothetical protein